MTELTQSQVLIRLADAEDNVSFIDNGIQYHYKRVKNPEGISAPYYELFFKKESNPTWFTVNGLLSTKFTIAKTESVVETIESSLNCKRTDVKIYRYSLTTHKYIFSLPGFEIPLTNVSAGEKFIFALLTGINLDTIKSNYSLRFSIINSMSGNESLQLQYYIMMNLSDPNSDTKASVNNMFVLTDHFHTLIHNNSLKLHYAEVSNVQSEANSIVNSYLNVPVTNEFINKFNSYFPKVVCESIIPRFSSLPKELQNLYYFTIITSEFVSRSTRYLLEKSLRRFVSDFFKESTHIKNP